jgi:hypothetical protein
VCGLLLINLATVFAQQCGPGVNFIRGPTCNSYFSCSNPEVEVLCPAGYFFDSAFQACGLEELVSCTDDCIGAADGSFLPRPEGGCGAYWTCAMEIGIPHICPDGLYFDPAGLCNYPDAVTCEGAPTLPTISTVPPTAPTFVTTMIPPPSNTPPGSISCAGRPNGYYIPYPANGCGGWQHCLNGVGATTGVCASGLYFDARQMCDWAELVTCNL